MVMPTQPRAMLVRLASWLDFEHSHPHDLMWPAVMLGTSNRLAARGFDVRLIDTHVDFDGPTRLIARIVSARPDVLLVESTTPSRTLAMDIARAVRRHLPGTQVWASGQHPSVQPLDVLVEGDAYHGVLLGEYDGLVDSWLDLLHGGPGGTGLLPYGQAIDAGSSNRPCEVGDLDALPPVRPTGLRLERYRCTSLLLPPLAAGQRWGYLLTSRGCPYGCTFCSPTLRHSYGTRFRFHSAQRVADDMQRLQRDHGCTNFYLIDDMFSLDRGRVLELCDALARRPTGIRWAVQTRADALDDQMLAAMASAGCAAVKVGVESGSDQVLSALKKQESRSQIVAAARRIKAAGLSLTGCFIVGNPGETADQVRQTMKLARELDADMIQIAFNTPYPGSVQYQRLADRIQNAEFLNHYESVEVNLSRMSDDELKRMHRRFYLDFYTSPRVLWNYLRRRGGGAVIDPAEWSLVASTLGYLFLSGGRGALGRRDEVASPSLLGHRVDVPRPIQRHRLCLTRQELGLIADHLRGGKVPTGSLEQFEEALAHTLGGRAAFAFESGRAALAMALWTLDLPPGSTVVLPQYGFYSLPAVVEALGLKARFAPVDPDRFGLDPERLADFLPGAACVVVIHPFGQVAQVAELAALCRARGIPLVEDGSQSTGASIQGRPVGSFGDLAVFSLVSGKNLQTFGGGIAVTSRSELADRMCRIREQRCMVPTQDQRRRLLGGLAQWLLTTRVGHASGVWPIFLALDRLAPQRLTRLAVEERTAFDPERPIRNLSEIQAALGILELASLEARNAMRRENATELRLRLEGLPGIVFQAIDSSAENTFNAVACRVRDADGLRRFLLARGIDIRYDYMEWFGVRPPDHDVVYLPNHPGMSFRDVAYLADAVSRWLRDGG